MLVILFSTTFFTIIKIFMHPLIGLIPYKINILLIFYYFRCVFTLINLYFNSIYQKTHPSYYFIFALYSHLLVHLIFIF